VPRKLKAREKINGMDLSLQHLLRYADESEDVLNIILVLMYHRHKLLDLMCLTGLLLGMNHGCSTINPNQSICTSMQWKHPSTPSTKKFKVMNMPSAGKVMLTVFWASQEVLLAHFQKCGEYVNSASYSEVLLKLQDAIRIKRPGQLARGGTASC
jgi:hypothetical protein